MKRGRETPQQTDREGADVLDPKIVSDAMLKRALRIHHGIPFRFVLESGPPSRFRCASETRDNHVSPRAMGKVAENSPDPNNLCILCKFGSASTTGSASKAIFCYQRREIRGLLTSLVEGFGAHVAAV
jgi:hypothetical protein